MDAKGGRGCMASAPATVRRFAATVLRRPCGVRGGCAAGCAEGGRQGGLPAA